MWYEAERIRLEAASGPAEAVAVFVAGWWGESARWEWESRAAGTFRVVGGSTLYRAERTDGHWVFTWWSQQ